MASGVTERAATPIEFDSAFKLTERRRVDFRGEIGRLADRAKEFRLTPNGALGRFARESLAEFGENLVQFKNAKVDFAGVRVEMDRQTSSIAALGNLSLQPAVVQCTMTPGVSYEELMQERAVKAPHAAVKTRLPFCESGIIPQIDFTGDPLDIPPGSSAKEAWEQFAHQSIESLTDYWDRLQMKAKCSPDFYRQFVQNRQEALGLTTILLNHDKASVDIETRAVAIMLMLDEFHSQTIQDFGRLCTAKPQASSVENTI